jgi:hypothetical protein
VSDDSGHADERTGEDWLWDGESWQPRDADRDRPPPHTEAASDHGWFWDGAQWQPAR